MKQNELEQIVNKINFQILSVKNGVPSLRDGRAEVIMIVEQAVLEERGRILELPKMQLENIGLPTTQRAEHSNYEKKIRNQLRRLLANDIESLTNTKDKEGKSV